MSRRRSSISRETALNIAFGLGVSYLAVEFFNLQLSSIADIKGALPFILLSELAGFKVKDIIQNKIGKKIKRKIRSRSRMRLGVKEKLTNVTLAIALLLILSVVIENNTNSQPFTVVKNTVAQVVSGLGNQVQAYSGTETNITVTSTSSNVVSPENSNVVNKIHAVFGADGADAIKVAMCESSLNPTIIGDKGLMFTDPETGEKIGDSVGLFQIRTGGINKDGSVWNRARENGKTAEQFRVWLQNPVNNINFAYQMFLQRGWQDWSCKP